MAKAKNAFTLVELLVVASVVSLLISILLPSLKKAREQAKLVVCLSNLRGIALASQVYAAADPKEMAIPVTESFFDPALPQSLKVMVGRHAYGGKSGRGREGSDSTFWGTGRSRGPAARPLNRFIYKQGFIDYRSDPGAGFANWKKDERVSLGLFRCPSDTGYQGIHYLSWSDSKLAAYDHFGNSYSANALLICWLGQDNWLSNSPFLRPLSRILNPANTIYYEEMVGIFHWRAEPIPENCHDEALPGPIHGWHGRDWFFNVAFADAHVAPIKMKGFDNPELSEYPLGGDYESWRCFIIRGELYQRDTLPAPPVDTGIEWHY